MRSLASRLSQKPQAIVKIAAIFVPHSDQAHKQMIMNKFCPDVLSENLCIALKLTLRRTNLAGAVRWEIIERHCVYVQSSGD